MRKKIHLRKEKKIKLLCIGIEFQKKVGWQNCIVISLNSYLKRFRVMG